MQPNREPTDAKNPNGARVIDLTDPIGRRSERALVPVAIAEPTTGAERGRSADRRLFLRRAWPVMLTGDLVGLLLPATFARHGRFELLTMAALTILLIQSAGMYRPQLRLSALDDLPRLFSRSVAALLFVGGFTAVVGYDPVLDTFFAIGAAAIALQILLRFVSYGLVRRARSRDRFTHRTIVVGGGEIAARIIARLSAEKSYGLLPVGYLDRAPVPNPVGVPYLGAVRELAAVLADHDARVVIVAWGDESDPEILQALRAGDLGTCEVFVAPRLFELHNYGQTDHIGAVPVVRLPRRGLRRSSWLVKRLVDVAVSAVALLLCTPIMAVAAVAVRLEGGPGVIFRQVRIGRGGREFELMKFRSLKPVDDNESSTRWNVSDDDRMGRVGRLLRQSSIDELPQLINILRGDMTLVGPRPERPHFAKTFSVEVPEYVDRHRMPMGLTGLAQVSGLRGDTSIADRARYDNFYIDNWTLWLDIKIMCDTVREVVGARGR